tara:strand:+ start:606 stop:1520 length:915 start_codon:yes stop_codon:yes gene_type:complete
MIMKQFVFLISMLFAVTIFAQAERGTFISQYHFSDMQINPAISGSKLYNPLILQTRKQWLGFEGAPVTSNISYHGALNNRSAMGGYLTVSNAYPVIQSSLSLNYAYHIPLDYNQVNLSFGLGSKISYYNIDFNQEDLPLENDPAFSSNSEDVIRYDGLCGFYLYGPNFSAGFSIDNLINTGDLFNEKEDKIYYGMGAYRFYITNNDWQFEPSFLLRKRNQQLYNNDFTARIIYLETTWASLAYRTNGTAVFGIGFAAKNLHISYSYDHTLTGDIMQYSYGTHEIGIAVRIETLASKRHISYWGY